MIRKPELAYASDHLRALRNKLANFRHGGIVLPSEEVEHIVRHLDESIDIAMALENTISRDEWNRRAAADRAVLTTREAAAVLEAMRPDGNVVRFPERPFSECTLPGSGPHRPGGRA